MKKLRIFLVSLLFICLLALMVAPVLAPAPAPPDPTPAAASMTAVDLAEEGTASLNVALTAPAPAILAGIPVSNMVAGLSCSLAIVLVALSLRRRTSQGATDTLSSPDSGFTMKCPLPGRL